MTQRVKCSICGENVFLYTNEDGSKVLFDKLGGNWPKHNCRGVIPNEQKVESLSKADPKAEKLTKEAIEAQIKKHLNKINTLQNKINILQREVEALEQELEKMTPKVAIILIPKKTKAVSIISVPKEQSEPASKIKVKPKVKEKPAYEAEIPADIVSALAGRIKWYKENDKAQMVALNGGTKGNKKWLRQNGFLFTNDLSCWVRK